MLNDIKLLYHFSNIVNYLVELYKLLKNRNVCFSGTNHIGSFRIIKTDDIIFVRYNEETVFSYDGESISFNVEILSYKDVIDIYKSIAAMLCEALSHIIAEKF